MARKYFGTEQALRKRLRIDNGQTEAIVSGVLAPQPPNQTMEFDLNLPHKTAKNIVTFAV